MHGYLFPMPIAVGPFPHPSYDTTAGEFLSFSLSRSFPKGSGRDLGCVSLLWFSCCKSTRPSMAKTFGNLLHKLGLLPQAHLERFSHVFSPPAWLCWDGLCSLPFLTPRARQEDKSILLPSPHSLGRAGARQPKPSLSADSVPESGSPG